MLTFLRIVCVSIGCLLTLMSAVLYENEEGAIQNKLEEWWIVLSDTESRAIRKHVAFVAGVAVLVGRLFDRLFGQKLLSGQSIGVAACFSLASTFLVCSPGLPGLLSDLSPFVYYLLIAALVAMGLLPAALRRGTPKKRRVLGRLWLTGVAILTFVAFVSMDVVDWFNLPFKMHGSGTEVYAGVQPSVEAMYYLLFIVLTIGCDWLFIAATRWLLRKGSKFDSTARILALTLGNVLLSCFLVIFPIGLAWGFDAFTQIIWSHSMVQTIVDFVSSSNAHQAFFATLGASNVLDGMVACIFFILLIALLMHRLFWPSLQRPVYALASRGIVRRRRLFFAIGMILVGFGGVTKSAIHVIGRIVAPFTDS